MATSHNALSDLPESHRKFYEKQNAEPQGPMRRWGYHKDCPGGRIFEGELPEGWVDHPITDPAPAAGSAPAATPSAGEPSGVRTTLSLKK